MSIATVPQVNKCTKTHFMLQNYIKRARIPAAGAVLYARRHTGPLPERSCVPAGTKDRCLSGYKQPPLITPLMSTLQPKYKSIGYKEVLRTLHTDFEPEIRTKMVLGHNGLTQPPFTPIMAIGEVAGGIHIRSGDQKLQ